MEKAPSCRERAVSVVCKTNALVGLRDSTRMHIYRYLSATLLSWHIAVQPARIGTAACCLQKLRVKITWHLAQVCAQNGTDRTVLQGPC